MFAQEDLQRPGIALELIRRAIEEPACQAPEENQDPGLLKLDADHGSSESRVRKKASRVSYGWRGCPLPTGPVQSKLKQGSEASTPGNSIGRAL